MARKTKKRVRATVAKTSESDYRSVEIGQIHRILDRLDGQLVMALRAHGNHDGSWADVPHLGDVLSAIALDTKIIRSALATSDGAP